MFVLGEDVAEVFARLLGLFAGLGKEGERLLTGAVESDDLKGAFGGDSHQVSSERLVGGVCDFALEDVGLEVVVGGIGGLQAGVFRGQMLAAFHVGVNLEVEATFELGTLAG